MTDESSVNKQRVSELLDRANWAREIMIAANRAADQAEEDVDSQRKRAADVKEQAAQAGELWIELNNEWLKAARQLKHLSDSEGDD